MVEYREVREGIFFCSIHNTFFKDKCPKCTLPSISHGTSDMFRQDVGFEQGVEQGVGSVTRAIHSHAFRFVVLLPDGLDNWSKRNDTLISKGFRATPKAGIGRIFMSDCFGFKCWFADKSITIYFPSWKRYFIDAARDGYNFAIDDLRLLLFKLQDIFNVSFMFDGAFHFKVSGQHHGLIHNSLAKMYNRNKEKLNVYDKNNELWLLIDNSNPEGFGLNECETVNHKTAVKDQDDVISKFFNELRDTELMPKDILLLFNNYSKAQEDFRVAITSYTEQINLHLKVEERQLLVQDNTLSTLNTIKDHFVNQQDSSPKVLSSNPADLSTREYRLLRVKKFMGDFGW